MNLPQTLVQKLWNKHFILLLNANLLMAIAFYFMTPIMPLFLADKFGLSADKAGIYMFSFTISAIIMRPFAGYLLDAYNRHLIYIISFVFFFAFFISYPIVASISILLLFRFLHGFTWGGINTAANTIAVDIIPQNRRGEGLGFFGLSMTLAMAISPMLAVAISVAYNYDVLFLSGAAISFVGLLLALLIKVQKIKNNKPNLTYSALIEKKAVPISLIPLLTQIPYGGIIAFVALYGRSIGIENSGTFFLVFAVGLAISKVLAGRLFDKMGPNKILYFGYILLIIGLLMIAFFNSSIGYHSSGLVLGFGFGVIAPTIQAMVNNIVAPDRRGAANSTYLMFFDSGIALGMLIFGLLIKSINFSGAFYVSAIIVFLSTIIFSKYVLPYYNNSKKQ